jgi:hypothetical protein
VRYKKRWSDGLHDDFEHLNEFELKFGLFGGDGGGGGGGSSSPDTKTQNTRAAAQEPARGRSTVSAAEQVEKSAVDRAEIARDIQNKVSQAAFDSGFFGNQTSQTAPGLADTFSNALVENNYGISPSRPSAFDKVSFSEPSFNMPSLADISKVAPSFSAPSNPFGQMKANVESLGFGSIPGTNTFGYNVPVGPGILGLGTNLSGDIGIGYNMRFAKGGSVPMQQGIASLQQPVPSLFPQYLPR